MTSKYDPAEALRVAIQARNLEIALLWQRSLFFWGFIASAFAGYLAIRNTHQFVAMLVACFGLVCSLSWTLINRGSKFWYENWEAKVKRLEGPVVRPLFALVEPAKPGSDPWLRGYRFSPSKLIIALSDYVFAMWLAIFAREIFRDVMPRSTWPDFEIGGSRIFAIFSFVYLILLPIICGRHKDDDQQPPDSGGIMAGEE